jgi:hypothetical protein
MSEPVSSTWFGPVTVKSTGRIAASRNSSLPGMSPFTVSTRMPASRACWSTWFSASGLFGAMAITSTPRWICASMKGICEVASAVAGATNSNSHPSSAQASSKPPVIESK